MLLEGGTFINTNLQSCRNNQHIETYTRLTRWCKLRYQVSANKTNVNYGYRHFYLYTIVNKEYVSKQNILERIELINHKHNWMNIYFKHTHIHIWLETSNWGIYVKRHLCQTLRHKDRHWHKIDFNQFGTCVYLCEWCKPVMQNEVDDGIVRFLIILTFCNMPNNNL